jgi:hypothetical protein
MAGGPRAAGRACGGQILRSRKSRRMPHVRRTLAQDDRRGQGMLPAEPSSRHVILKEALRRSPSCHLGRGADRRIFPPVEALPPRYTAFAFRAGADESEGGVPCVRRSGGPGEKISAAGLGQRLAVYGRLGPRRGRNRLRHPHHKRAAGMSQNRHFFRGTVLPKRQPGRPHPWASRRRTVSICNGLAGLGDAGGPMPRAAAHPLLLWMPIARAECPPRNRRHTTTAER